MTQSKVMFNEIIQPFAVPKKKSIIISHLGCYFKTHSSKGFKSNVN